MKLIIALLVIGAALVVAGLYFAGVGIGGRAIGLAVPGIASIVAAAMRATDKLENEIMDDTHGEDFRCDEHGSPKEVDRDR